MHYFPTCQQSFFLLSAIIEGKTITRGGMVPRQEARNRLQLIIHSLSWQHHPRATSATWLDDRRGSWASRAIRGMLSKIAQTATRVLRRWQKSVPSVSRFQHFRNYKHAGRWRTARQWWRDGGGATGYETRSHLSFAGIWPRSKAVWAVLFYGRCLWSPSTFEHPGIEFIYMLAGKIEYRHGQYTYLLEPGDSLTFQGDVSHGPENW